MSFLSLVLLASLGGSFHCAAMCGGFVCVYSGGCGPGDARSRAHAAYNLARLVAYAALGALAGALGAGVESLGAMAGLGRAAAVLAGTLMIFWGASEVLRAVGAPLSVPKVNPMAWVRRSLGRALAASRQMPAPARAATIGALSALLPCGWLYAFVATAAASGSPLGGVAVMIAFWAGTVPALLAVGYGAQRVFGTMSRRLPVVAAALLMALGVLTIAGRIHAPLADRSRSAHVGH
jgi:sulfite exporter TauE/SafE